ncbi:SprT family zinc-dependent metalloprotease [Maribellus sp. YY47]|uniref:M48 family metallopeptidase n=1 Tax=Maribellus sp. YY47 TaxID=2929486 RepID=UPI002001C58A|nr:SprT family zinc-dependent metalloprotease [Maribellus sp. YY47]MCK3682762.1 M48 family metallopeptidase [Maribellus sp. YY47]
MPNQVVQLKHIGQVTFSKNSRSKNIKLSIKPDKSILVSYPFYVSSKEVVNFVLKNEAWILEQQSRLDARKTKIDPEAGMKTKLYQVQFLKSDANRVSRKGKVIRIMLADFDSDQSKAFAEKCLTEIYRFEAKQILPGRLAELAKQHGFQYNKVTIRDNRRNWGSCSSANNISLNLQMMKLPDALIDYILLHELVHTEVKNHGPKFWQRLDEITGHRAKELAGQVRKFSTYIL